MIVVVGRVVTDAERRDELVRIGQAVAQASRAEEGCLGYRLYADTEADHEFVFVEEWEDDAALQRHFATSHVAEFMRDVRATLAATPDVAFHTIADSRSLDDVAAE